MKLADIIQTLSLEELTPQLADAADTEVTTSRSS